MRPSGSGRSRGLKVFGPPVNELDPPAVAGSNSSNDPMTYVATFARLKSLPCDVFLEPHSGFFNLADKRERMEKGETPNPFIDGRGYRALIEKSEETFRRQWKMERVRIGGVAGKRCRRFSSCWIKRIRMDCYDRVVRRWPDFFLRGSAPSGSAPGSHPETISEKGPFIVYAELGALNTFRSLPWMRRATNHPPRLTSLTWVNPRFAACPGR